MYRTIGDHLETTYDTTNRGSGDLKQEEASKRPSPSPQPPLPSRPHSVLHGLGPCHAT